MTDSNQGRRLGRSLTARPVGSGARRWPLGLLALGLISSACGQPGGNDLVGSGGTTGVGGSGSGGLPAAGGGSGGLVGSGGTTAGGGSNGSGGAASGGTAAGGAGSGGTGPGSGAASGSGGVGSGGDSATGGAPSGGGSNFEPVFILGADISTAQEVDATYTDTDGQTKDLFSLLSNHGFNYVRLRTFVNPSAPGGYASTANGCPGKSEAYGDKAHVIEYGKLAKDAGMGFLLDFHYSDVWADPGNQIIPEAWRGATTTDQLADLLATYTKDVLEDAIAAGARPDMVQVGNEITPGTAADLPDGGTDCWGNNPGSTSPIGGNNWTEEGWDRLAILLKAGIAAVREVDPTIKIMLHIENTDDLAGVQWWVSSAVERDVEFDVLGLSCYEEFQGPPSTWETTFEAMAADYPELEFAIAEYNPQRTAANMIMKNLEGGRGLGTFFWEPTLSGEWGPALFTGDDFDPQRTAIDTAFQEYDDMLDELGL